MNEKSAKPRWRPMAETDIDGVVGVARASFPDHFEAPACFAERLALYPRGCFTLAAGDVAVGGYLIAYPWQLRTVPPLDSLIGALPEQADSIYLHDLALRPELRGQGHTRPVVDRLAGQAAADGWSSIALVAVNRAEGFWERLGFEVATLPGMSRKLASYGADAAYMIRNIA